MVASAALAPATTRHSISCRFRFVMLCNYPAARGTETGRSVRFDSEVPP
jgi:hypothetical protein